MGDEEITVIENVSDAVEDIPTEDLKPKDLRTLIMSYIELVQKFSSDKNRAKYSMEDIKMLRKNTKIDKNIEFFTNFFVSQTQVTLIANYGIKDTEDILANVKDEKEIKK